MAYVEINKVKKSFNNIDVLKEISFSIEKGEFLTLLGPSGCGKSTLLRTIAGLNKFDSGTIIVDDKDISNEKPKDRQVGMVFQSYALFPNMTVFDNIAFGLKMQKLSKDEIKEKVNNIIKIVDLVGKENSYPHQLSGGQQQRVALARSIVTEPKILLLDEPLSALDAKIRKNLQRQIRDIQQKLNMTTIFVTHDQDEAMTMSDKIIVMDKGVIAQQGTPDEIYINPANEFIARFIGNYNVLTKKESNKLFEFNIEDTIAIRPEAIRVVSKIDKDTKNNVYIKGIIKQKYMIGSIIRMEVYKNDTKLLVDILNQQNNFKIGEEISLEILKEDIKYLSSTVDNKELIIAV